jgi:MoaA/NifB/PqqE/SkfB family radical SAM enzyme
MRRKTIEPTPLHFKFYQPRADHPDWKAIHEQAVDQARAIAPLIHTDDDDTLIDRASDRLRKMKGLATAANNYLINRQRWQDGNHALRPMYFIWSMLYTCNFRCTYCDDHRGNHYFDLPDSPMSFADRSRMIRTMRTGTSAIYFCGGEPTLVRELPLFTDMCFNLGYYPLMINSNGFVLHEALKRPEWRKWLRQMDIIIISLDGLELTRLRELWGIKKVEQVFVNLLMLRELRRLVDFKLMVNTVVGPDSIPMASDVLDFINDLGDVWYVPVPVNYHGKDKDGFAFERDMIVRPDYQDFAARILERQRQGQLLVGSRRILENLLYVKPYTCLPTLRPHVDPDGNVCWPCRAPKNVDFVKVNVLDYDTLDAAWEAATRLRSPARFHGPGPQQCGDNCAWMQNYTTGRYHDLLTDPLHSGILSEIKEFAFKNI